MTLLVLDDRDKTKRRHMFHLLGVEYVATPYFWLNIPLMMIAGIILSSIFVPTGDLARQIVTGIAFGILIIVAMFMHGIGHIISSRMVNAPVKQIVMTMTVNYLDFGEEGEQPSRVHVGRSLGGPVMNVVLGVVSLAVYGFGGNSDFILFFGAINLLIAIVTILPIPSLDGPVILRELRNWKSTNTT